MNKIIAWANPQCDYCRHRRHVGLLALAGMVVEVAGFMLALELRDFKPFDPLIAAITTVVTVQLCWPAVKFGFRDKGHP